uniref:Uncharacterized protein n=1 Tax=Anguilla anguilla TaxID=7936 RepID=A0A0E9PT75_ANGAN
MFSACEQIHRKSLVTVEDDMSVSATAYTVISTEGV